MHRLGAAIITISLTCLVLAQVSYTVNNNFPAVVDMHVEGYAQIGTGLAFILASLLCKLGAEQRPR